jgi:PAS domain S-box-containing protein
VNATTLSYTGRTLEEIRNWACTVHPDDVPVVAARKTHAMTTGEPFDVDVRVLRADGVYRWFHCLGLPFRDSDGRIIRWYDLLTDIDDRKRVEDMLRTREREYREIIDSMPGLVAVWNPQGETEFVNERALTYFGTSLQHLQQWRDTDTIHPDDLPRVTEVWTRAIAAGEPFECEERLRRHDGEYRWFHLRAVPDRDRDGNIIRWPVLITDVDDRRRAEDARQHLEKAKQIDQHGRQIPAQFDRKRLATLVWREHDGVHEPAQCLGGLPPALRVLKRTVAGQPSGFAAPQNDFHGRPISMAVHELARDIGSSCDFGSASSPSSAPRLRRPPGFSGSSVPAGCFCAPPVASPTSQWPAASTTRPTWCQAACIRGLHASGRDTRSAAVFYKTTKAAAAMIEACESSPISVWSSTASVTRRSLCTCSASGEP